MEYNIYQIRYAIMWKEDSVAIIAARDGEEKSVLEKALEKKVDVKEISNSKFKTNKEGLLFNEYRRI